MQAIWEVGGISQGRKQSVKITFPLGIIDRLENPVLRTPLVSLALGFGRHPGYRFGGWISSEQGR
jgi:hypothetical protein